MDLNRFHASTCRVGFAWMKCLWLWHCTAIRCVATVVTPQLESWNWKRNSYFHFFQLTAGNNQLWSVGGKGSSLIWTPFELLKYQRPQVIISIEIAFVINNEEEIDALFGSCSFLSKKDVLQRRYNYIFL